MHVKQISKGTKGHMIKMKSIPPSPSYLVNFLSTEVTTVISSSYLSRDAAQIHR